MFLIHLTDVLIAHKRSVEATISETRWVAECCGTVPPVCWVELRGDHIQGVPSRDAEAVVQTKHEDHHGLAGAKPKKEATDARQHHRAPCRTIQITAFTNTEGDVFTLY